MADPRFQFFYDLVRITNFFRRERTSPLLYIFENTWPGGKQTDALRKAGALVESFIGAPVMVDAAGLGAAAHIVRLFWQNFQRPEILHAALPSDLPPAPPLNLILHPYHIPTKPGHSDRNPFSPQNHVGGERRVVVSYIIVYGK